MFEYSEEICEKISNSGCITNKELQYVEMALKMFESYEEILNQNLGLDIIEQKELEVDFKLKYAIGRNTEKRVRG